MLLTVGFPMKGDELRRFKRVLIARRRELLRRKNDASSPDQTTPGPADLADQARMGQQTEIIERLRQTNSHLLGAIEEALERIKRGTFGVCAHCGRPIGRLRLQAVPWTSLCLDCKEHRASRGSSSCQSVVGFRHTSARSQQHRFESGCLRQRQPRFQSLLRRMNFPSNLSR